jgi:hypothetical protein
MFLGGDDRGVKPGPQHPAGFRGGQREAGPLSQIVEVFAKMVFRFRLLQVADPLL